MNRGSCLWAALAATLAFAPASARAGGLGRPNPLSARSNGMGGAFAALADDPSALHYNPAGMAFQLEDTVLLGAQFVLAPRAYTPVTDSGGEGEEQRTDKPAYLPILGYTTRVSAQGVPSRLALGVGLWNTYGGSAEFERGPINVAYKIQNAVLELVPGVAYEVNDHIGIGAALRIGIGLLDIGADDKPLDAMFSGRGVGAGMTLGLMLRPMDELSIGLTYRSAMTVSVSGSGEVETATGDFTDVEVLHEQRWPQSAVVGLSYRVTPALVVAAQVDWTDWSHLQDLVYDLQPVRVTVEPVEFRDGITLHAGAAWAATEALDVRAGVVRDSRVVPDRTMQRHFLGGPYTGVAVGSGYRLTRRWRLDASFEHLLPSRRTVDDNLSEYQAAGWPTQANLAPGRYESSLYTFELNAAYRY